MLQFNPKLITQVNKARREGNYKQAIQIMKQPTFPDYWKPQLLREIANDLTSKPLQRLEYLQLVIQISQMPELDVKDRPRILSSISRMLAKEGNFDRALAITSLIPQSYEYKALNYESIARQAIKKRDFTVAQQMIQRIKTTEYDNKDFMTKNLALGIILATIEMGNIQEIYKLVKNGTGQQGVQKLFKYVSELDESQREFVLFTIGMKSVRSNLPLARQIHKDLKPVPPSSGGGYKRRDLKSMLLRQIQLVQGG
jgi:hypothetical protein